MKKERFFLAVRHPYSTERTATGGELQQFAARTQAKRHHAVFVHAKADGIFLIIRTARSVVKLSEIYPHREISKKTVW